MRAKAHIRRQSQLSKNPFLRLGGKAVATATKIGLYTPRIWRQAPNRIHFQHSKPMTRNLFSRSLPGPLADASIGKAALSSAREKKQGGFKKNPESLSLRYFSAPPPGGGPPLRYSRKTSVAVMLVVFALFFHQTFARKQTIRSRRGFLKGENRGRLSRGVAAQTRKRINAPAPAQTAVWRRLEKARRRLLLVASNAFRAIQPQSAKDFDQLRRPPLPNRLPKNSAQLNRPLRFSASNFFARFLDERLLSHIRIDQLF